MKRAACKRRPRVVSGRKNGLMLIQGFNKKFLFSSTVIAGLSAVMVAGSVQAQTTTQPPTSTPQTSDSTPGANEVVQQSPNQGAPE
ncbi:MAG: hypothetical protein M3M95_08195, partial [Pseudomonadota bacterium]|nr:hypothetical protein [Pseudomonadota bacterium]